MVRRGSITAAVLLIAAIAILPSTGSSRTHPLPLGPGPVVISRIAGVLQICGGPAPGGCRVESFTLCGPPSGCVHADRVRVIGRSATVATLRLRHGRFSVTVAPGRYIVQLLGDGPHVDGRVLQQKTVTARRYATAHVTFTIDIP